MPPASQLNLRPLKGRFVTCEDPAMTKEPAQKPDTAEPADARGLRLRLERARLLTPAQLADGARPAAVSFEFFPPHNAAMERTLWDAVMRLAPLAPEFVSVTYGAGGSTRERTHATVTRIRRETSLAPAAHLTCVGATKDEVDAIARRYERSGIRHLVALRGDAPGMASGYRPHRGGYPYAAELVAGLRGIADFDITVAAYPETHPQAKSPEADLDNLKRKIDAGANRAISQFFFEPEVFLRFEERARRTGITIPIVPGILPVTNCARVLRFSRSCGTEVPGWLRAMFQGLDDDPQTRTLVAAAIAARQCQALSAAGVKRFHFYTLNRADLTYAICHILGLRTDGNLRAGGDSAHIAASL